jgi:hypothetical protein
VRDARRGLRRTRTEGERDRYASFFFAYIPGPARRLLILLDTKQAGAQAHAQALTVEPRSSARYRAVQPPARRERRQEEGVIKEYRALQRGRS